MVKIKTSDLPGFNDDSFNETEYYFDNGLRKVYPYYFSYNMFCKKKWIGEQLLNVMADEYPVYTREQYRDFIKAGTLMVNKKSISFDYILKNGDLITNFVHRHEAPVLAAPLKIVYQSNDFLIIDKPPSIPVHPCGRYRHNSIALILGKENNLKNLYNVHRLDRLTSGLLIFGLNQRFASKIIKHLEKREIQKEYLCRVEGNFIGGEITCNEPITSYSRKIGISLVDKDGKKCVTEFKKLNFNGKSSVVLCKPLTGRTHQIRVHLQYLGYPIINDPIYNTEMFGPYKGKNGNYGRSKQQLVKDFIIHRTSRKWLTEESAYSNNTDKNMKTEKNLHIDKCQLKVFQSLLSNYINLEDYLKLSKSYQFDPGKLKNDSNCINCTHNIYKDPKPQDLLMFLHAYRYRGKGWDFQTTIPSWAKEDWTEN